MLARLGYNVFAADIYGKGIRPQTPQAAGAEAGRFKNDRALLRVRVDVRAEVRTGDTPAAKRLAMARKPPHILVTTPESSYLLLTSASGRKLLATVRTLITPLARPSEPSELRTGASTNRQNFFDPVLP